MYKALDIAKYVVAKCYKDGKPITNLKLQKILYFIQKEYLCSGSKAFSDDIEAWMYGPVVSDVYYHYCTSGAMPIFSIDDKDLTSILSEEDKERINKIIDKYIDYDVWKLVELTHTKGGAWDSTFTNKGAYHIILDDDIIKLC